MLITIRSRIHLGRYPVYENVLGIHTSPQWWSHLYGPASLRGPFHSISLFGNPSLGKMKDLRRTCFLDFSQRRRPRQELITLRIAVWRHFFASSPFCISIDFCLSILNLADVSKDNGRCFADDHWADNSPYTVTPETRINNFLWRHIRSEISPCLFTCW